MGGAEEFRVGPDEDPDCYRLLHLHSSGAEGQVWRGSRALESGVVLDVAIKILHPERSGLISEWRDRWTEQVELLRSLHYPGVVPVREAFEGPLMHTAGESVTDRSLYLVMNWIDGETLHEWVSRRQPDVFEALRLLTQVADALDYMHSGRVTDGKPVVHRDVKPANIIVSDNVAVLVDFGLVRALTKEAPLLPGIVGTVAYMAPEVVTKGAYTPESDRYALGCVAYYMLTRGDPPKDNDLTKMRQKLTAVPALGANRSLLDHLMTMLDPDPAARPTKATAWVQLFRSSTITGTESAETRPMRTVPPQPPSPVPDPHTARVTPPPRRSRRLIPVLAALAVLVAGIGAYAAFAPKDDPSTLRTDAQGATVTSAGLSTTSTRASGPTTSVPPTVSTTTPSAAGGRPTPDLSAAALQQILLTAADVKPVFDGRIPDQITSTRVTFELESPTTAVCKNTAVPTALGNDPSALFYLSPPEAHAGSKAAVVADAATTFRNLVIAATTCGLQMRNGSVLGDETLRYVEPGSSYREPPVDRVFVRRGSVVVEVVVRTESGQHSVLADDLATIVAGRIPAA